MQPKLAKLSARPVFMALFAAAGKTRAGLTE
jgi:hypothetical protein